MKILHIHTSLAGGGIESIICGLLNRMVQSVDVTLATIFAPKSTDLFEQRIDKRVKRLNLGKIKGGFSLSEIFKIYKLISRGEYDIVHIHGFFYYYALAVMLLHRKTKFYYTIHSDAYMENTKWDKRLFWLKKFCFKRGFIHPITISHASQTSFYNLYHTPSSLICNGVAQPDIDTTLNPIEQYKISEKTRVFVHAGRINVAKNQLVLCEAFERIIKDGHDVVLLIAGGNNDNKIMEQLTPYFCERIRYIGERSDVPALFYFAEAMCLPSIWEGLPITLLEALSVGCIPICSPVGGIVNVIRDGHNGLLSADASADAYYTTLCRYLQMSRDEIKAMRREAINSFSKFDIKTTVAQYLEAYGK